MLYRNKAKISQYRRKGLLQPATRGRSRSCGFTFGKLSCYLYLQSVKLSDTFYRIYFESKTVVWSFKLNVPYFCCVPDFRIRLIHGPSDEPSGPSTLKFIHTPTPISLLVFICGPTGGSTDTSGRGTIFLYISVNKILIHVFTFWAVLMLILSLLWIKVECLPDAQTHRVTSIHNTLFTWPFTV